MNETARKTLLALSAVVFFTAFSTALMALGDHQVRIIALLALLLAGVSQFVAQDAPTHVAIYRVSLALAYASIISAIVALVLFAI